MRVLATMMAVLVMAATASGAAGAGRAGPTMLYGIQDDAYLEYGPGTADERVANLQQLGIGIVRFTLRWDAVEETEGTYDWALPDTVLEALRDAGIDAVVTLYGTPRWANGGKGPNVAPVRGSDFARFAGAAAERYPSFTAGRSGTSRTSGGGSRPPHRRST